MLGILSVSDWERALPPSTEITELTFVVKKVLTMMLSGVVYFLENRRENLKFNVVLIVVFFL